MFPKVSVVVCEADDVPPGVGLVDRVLLELGLADKDPEVDCVAVDPGVRVGESVSGWLLVGDKLRLRVTDNVPTSDSVIDPLILGDCVWTLPLSDALEDLV